MIPEICKTCDKSEEKRKNIYNTTKHKVENLCIFIISAIETNRFSRNQLNSLCDRLEELK